MTRLWITFYNLNRPKFTLEKIIIFGTGQLAQILHDYIEEDQQFEIIAYTQDNPTQNQLNGLPIVDFAQIQSKYPPDTYKMLIVIGFSKRNQKRKNVFERVKSKGYCLVNYIHATSILHKTTKMGENCIILANNNFEPHVCMGNNVIMLSSNIVGHHTNIDDHCFITTSVCVAGRVTINSGATLGLHCTIKQHIKIAEKTFVGANVFVKSDTAKNSVYEAPDPKIISTD